MLVFIAPCFQLHSKLSLLALACSSIAAQLLLGLWLSFFYIILHLLLSVICHTAFIIRSLRTGVSFTVFGAKHPDFSYKLDCIMDIFHLLSSFFPGCGLICGESQSGIHSHILLSGNKEEATIQRLTSDSYWRYELPHSRGPKNVFKK